MNILRSGLKIFSSKVTASMLNFGAIVYFSRELGPTQIGIFFLFETLLMMISMVVDFGFSGALEKRLSEVKGKSGYFTTALLLKLCGILLTIPILLLLSDFINDYLGANLIIYLIIAICLFEIRKLIYSTLIGELRPAETAPLIIVEKGTWLILGSVLLFILDVKAIIISLIFGYIASLVLGIFKLHASLGKPSLHQLKSLYNYAKYNIISSVGGFIYNWMDVALIGLFLTTTEVGQYEIAWRVSLLFILLSTALSQALFPQISKLGKIGNKRKIEELISNYLTYSLILIIPGFFGAIILSEQVLSIVFGKEFIVASIVLVILMAEKLTQGIQLVIGKSLQALDFPNLAARATVYGVVLNLILNVALIPYYGIEGAAMATAISSLVGGALFHGYYLSHQINLKFNFMDICWCFFSGIVMAIIVYAINAYFTISSILQLCVIIMIGTIVYGAFIYLYKPIREKLIKDFDLNF